MSIVSKVFNGNGSTKIFQSDFKVLSENHIEVRIDGELASKTLYDTINNAAVFKVAPAPNTTVEVLVGTTPDELLTAPTDNATLATNIDKIQAVYDGLTNINLLSNYTTKIDDIYNNLDNIGNAAALEAGLLTPVLDSLPEIEQVAGLYQAINTVAFNGSELIIVANNIADVNTTAFDISKVNIVANDLNGYYVINSVDHGSITEALDEETVETDSNIVTVAENIQAIIDAYANATVATNKANEASASALSASNSASSASTSASTATAQATISTNKANEASNSATNAENNAISSAASALESENSKVAAQGYASDAQTASVNASGYATSASGSATTATTQAGIATTKASEASVSASNASTSEANAAQSAIDAANSAASIVIPTGLSGFTNDVGYINTTDDFSLDLGGI